MIAERRLRELCWDVLQNQSPKTLAYFRLTNAKILKDLQEFATPLACDNSGEPTSLLKQVLDLFKHLNRHMAEQEQTCPTWGDFFEAASEDSSPQSLSPICNEISVVFGGKYSKDPASISEQLVSRLVKRSKTVYTVSRSTCVASDLPTNVKHMSKKNLDVRGGECSTNSPALNGTDEFYDVMSIAREEWLRTPLPTTIVFYFTLGQHKGINPFVRNLNAAVNFHRALQKFSVSLSEVDDLSPSSPRNKVNCGAQNHRNWRVVLTGTDATLPSTHPPSQMVMSTAKNTTKSLAVPTYKIANNNYVYAMSKLGQYYRIANSVARVVLQQNADLDSEEHERKKYKEIIRETEEVFQRIEKHVTCAGEDGTYHGDETSETSDTAANHGGISMAELNEISRTMSCSIEKELRDHYHIAKQISICYTPLHAKPWTDDAINNIHSETDTPAQQLPSSATLSLQRALILEQIVTRLKNAISIDSAASSHFPR